MQTLEELNSKVDELTAQVEEKKDEVKDKDAKHKAEMDEKEKEHKSAMDEKEHEKKSAMDEEKEKHESTYKSMYSKMKSAMNEETDEKKKEGMKAVLQAMNEEHKKEAKRGDMDKPEVYEKKGKSAEEMKKDREHEAEITYLTAEIIKPKIKQLDQLYKASKTPEDKIEEYKAAWKNLTGKQLDAEIEKMNNIIGNVIPNTFEAQNSAFGFGTTSSLKKLHQFDASKFSSKIDKMSDSQLFNSGVN